MLIALVASNALILLLGAAAVKNRITNIVGFGIGGLPLLLLARKLGPYFGEYGLLCVIGITAAAIAGIFDIGIHFEEKARSRILSSPEQ